jgi:UDP-N-acetylmuramoylalanine--D-glutamate ligase
VNLLQDRHVLVLGLGLSGLAMARWCAAQGASVTVADTRAEPPQLAALRQQLPTARFVSGALDASLLDDASVRAVYRSPGLSPASIAGVARAARERGLPVGGELDLFVQALAGLKQQRDYQPALLAITGTNGKTTVTALTGQLVERAGLSVAVAGNIGPSLLDTLRRGSMARRCRRSGCWSCRVFSWTGWWASSRRRPRCSTSRRITWTGMATWPLTRRPRRGCLASTA